MSTVLDTINASKMNPVYVEKEVDYEVIFEELDINFYEVDSSIWNDKSFETRWVERWLCTDTYVGLAVIFLDWNPVAITWQPYRKSDTDILWIHKKSIERVRERLDKYLIKDEDTSNIVSELDEIPEWWKKDRT